MPSLHMFLNDTPTRAIRLACHALLCALTAALAACGGGTDSASVATGATPARTTARAAALAAKTGEAAPGDVLSSSPLATSLGLADAGEQFAFSYRSTDGVSGTGWVTTTGAIFFPKGTAPAGGWPVIAWGHGATGIGDSCAPSRNARSARDAEYLNRWLREGFVVVATDYQGLGTPGLHLYLHARAESYALLDSVRAALKWPNVSNQVVLAGQAQGAHAVFAATDVAGTYAPELNVLGTLATSTPHMSRVNEQPYGPDAVNPTLFSKLYLAKAAQLLDPTLTDASLFSARALPVYANAAEECASSLWVSVIRAGLTSNNTFATADSQARMNAVLRDSIRYPTLALPRPIFMGIGAQDTSVSTEQQVALATDACKAGATVAHKVYAGTNQDTALNASFPDALAFVQGLMAGQPVSATCASLVVVPVAGDVVSSSPLPTALGLTSAGAQHSFNYLSTDGFSGSGLVTTSGAIFFPQGAAPAGGWPVVVWGHGTAGIGDNCAPSRNVRSTRDATYLNRWLSAGYVVVATDYQGLGTPGPHFYLHARAEGYALLDSARAALKWPHVANRFVLVGQSQGGNAVFAAAGYAATYAPEINLRGTVATGTPHLMRTNVPQYGPDETNPNIYSQMYLAKAAQQIDPSFTDELIFSARALPLFANAAEQCTDAMYVSIDRAGLTANNTYATPESRPRMNTLVREALRYSTLNLPRPIFMGVGAQDRSVSAEQQVALAADACRAGSTVVHKVYAADHGGALNASFPDALAFATLVMNGETPASTCGSLVTP